MSHLIASTANLPPRGGSVAGPAYRQPPPPYRGEWRWRKGKQTALRLALPRSLTAHDLSLRPTIQIPIDQGDGEARKQLQGA